MMRKMVVFSVALILSFLLCSVSEAVNLKKAIIGKWVEVKKDVSYGGQFEFLKDGTIIIDSTVGDYKFIDDNRLRLDIKGIFGQGAMVLEVSIDKQGQLILTDTAGSVSRFITKAEWEKKAAAERAKREKADEAKALSRTYRDQGNAYHNKGQYDQAIEKYNKAIALDPNNAFLYENRGYVYLDKGQYDRVIADFTKAIALRPTDIAAYFARADVYFKKGEYEKAIEDFSKVIAIEPNNAYAYSQAYSARGSAYSMKGQYDRAIEDCNKAIAIDQNNVVPYYIAGTYSLLGNVSAACDWLNKAIGEGYNNWDFIKKDSDLNKIRNSDCYKKIMEGKGIKRDATLLIDTQSKDVELQKVKAFIGDQWKLVPQIPESKRNWRELVPLAVWGKYDDYSTLYLMALNRRGLTNDALVSADKFLKKGDLKNAKKYADLATRHYIESNELFKASEQVFIGSVEMTAQTLEAMYRGPKEASKYGWFLMCGPKCYEVADYVFLMTDFAMDYGLEGMNEAKKNLIVNAFVKTLLKTSGVSKWIENRTTHLIGDSGLYGLMDKTLNSPEFQKVFMEVLAESGAYTTQKMANEGGKKIIYNSLAFIKASSNLKPEN